MRKVLLIGGAVLLIIVGGFNTLKSYIHIGSTASTTTSPVTTTAPTIFDNINSQLVTLKTNDVVLQSKIDQITQLLQIIQGEIEALRK